MIIDEQIENNKNRFLELISGIRIEGADLDGFLRWVSKKSDFFEAPASTKYHCSYPGGLCEHSLNVYDRLCELVDLYATHMEPNPNYKAPEDDDEQNSEQTEPEFIKVRDYSDDSIKVVALLHDVAKANFYEQYEKNVKNDAGEWTKVKEYRTRDYMDRFVYGSHEQTCEYIVHTFFPLTVEESVAILHHHGGQSWDSSQDNIGDVFNKYKLAALLHMADMLATFVNEKPHE